MFGRTNKKKYINNNKLITVVYINRKIKISKMQSYAHR